MLPELKAIGDRVRMNKEDVLWYLRLAQNQTQHLNNQSEYSMNCAAQVLENCLERGPKFDLEVSEAIFNFVSNVLERKPTPDGEQRLKNAVVKSLDYRPDLHQELDKFHMHLKLMDFDEVSGWISRATTINSFLSPAWCQFIRKNM